MKYFVLFLTSILVISCSSTNKVPEIKASVVKNTISSASAPVVTNEVPAAAPLANVNREMPDIKGSSVLDVNCAFGQDRRIISLIQRTDATGWGVVYSKYGSKKTIAVARQDKAFCEEVVSRVKSKLQSSGFECDGAVAPTSQPITGDDTNSKAL